MQYFSEKIYTPSGFKKGYLTVEEGRITGIEEKKADDHFEDYGDKIIVPGFVDVHIHGWATGSFTHQGDEKSLENMSKDLVNMGVTSYLATSGTDAVERLNRQVNAASSFVEKWSPLKGSEVIGVHLEGPFINEEYKGMQKGEYCIPPSVDSLNEIVGENNINLIKLITMAPELPGSEEVIKHLNKLGIQISVGHSAAEFEDIERLKDFGLGGFTHTFSGMRGMHHRRLGVAGAAMYFDDMYAEFGKQTGLTVKPEAFSIVYKIKGPDKINLTTDCTGLAQTKTKKYHYIRKMTFEPEGDTHVKVTTDDGDVNILNKKNYDEVKDVELGFLNSVKNVVKNIDASIGDIVKMASENPAKYVGVYNKKGSLEYGKDADFLVVDGDWNLYDCYVQGTRQKLN